MPDERALPTAEQRDSWAVMVRAARHGRGVDGGNLAERVLLAIDAERDLLWQFYRAWADCEGGRGAYSCCPRHDCRCEKDRGISQTCTCGRDELDRLAAILWESEEAKRE